MRISFSVLVIGFSGLILTAADQDWKGKPPADWKEVEAKQILSDSPWTKVIAPAVLKSIYPEKDQVHGWRSKIGLGGSAHKSADATSVSGTKGEPPKPPPAPALKLRWESALPVRLAERKVPDPAAPAVDDDHYVMAVYGIPRSMVPGDLKELSAILKKNALLKRYAKRDMIPASVDILMRDDGPVIVYRFLKSGDINWRDQKLIFDAQIDTLKFTQTFDLDPMRFEGDLQL